jgi:hypothetical protein
MAEQVARCEAFRPLDVLDIMPTKVGSSAATTSITCAGLVTRISMSEHFDAGEFSNASPSITCVPGERADVAEAQHRGCRWRSRRGDHPSRVVAAPTGSS